MSKRVLTLLLSVATLLFFFSKQLQAQAQAQDQELKPGWYTIGFNVGLSYQQSDVQTRINKDSYGVGLTLAKNVLHMPNGGFDFDLRGRLMYSASVGLSPDRSFNVNNNAAVNGLQRWDYRVFPEELEIETPFIFNNHFTQKAELGLEGVLTFSKLRKKTGIVLSLFGGIGLDWFLVNTDQGNEGLGADYKAGYASVNMDATRAQRRRVLRETILNGNYESLADGFENHQFGRLRFMPGWGVELGYDINTWWGIGLGHKVTYTGVDYFDGYRIADSRQDIHHYTYLQIWRRFNGKDRVEEPPIINITNPPYTPYSTRDPYQLITADIENIRRSRQINVTFNDQPVDFNYRKGSLSLDVLLDDGINEVIIYAQNSAGEAEAQQVIVLEDPENDDPPFISFITPPAPGIIVSEPPYHIQAEILNMESSRNITFLVNNRRTSNFQFDFDNNLLSSNIRLKEGRNTVEIIAFNRRGEDRKISTIIYEKPVFPPSLTFVRPSVSPFITNLPVATLEVDLSEIDLSRGDQISIIYNGYRLTNYSYDQSRGRLRAELPLTINENFLSITISNKTGADRGELVIIRKPDTPVILPPSIQVNQASVSAASSGNCQAEFDFTVRHIIGKQNIQIRLGNKNVSNFNLDRNSGRVWLSTRVLTGPTELIIIATNESGTATEQVQVICEASTVVEKPSVTITTPPGDDGVNQSRIATVTKLANIERKDQIKVTLNGEEVRSFNWEVKRNEVTTNLILKAGENIFRVEAKNAAGMAADERLLTYLLPELPTVEIIKPLDGSTVNSPNVSFEAITEYITSKNQIDLLLNGESVKGFSFSNNTVKVQLTLKYGENTISIKVRNKDGQGQATAKINYRIPLPVISFISPTVDTIVEESAFNLFANLEHVAAARDISLKVNGAAYTRFNFNQRNGQLSQQLLLTKGENTIQIIAENLEGQSSQSIRILYVTSQVPPPKVRIISASQPVFDPFNPEDGFSNLIAEVTGVPSVRSIELLHNGKSIGDFEYDQTNGRLTHRIKLTKGDNVIEVKAVNADGLFASDERTVRF